METGSFLYCKNAAERRFIMAKLFVIAGHGAGDPGAVGNGYQEYERVRALASKIKELGGDNVTVGDKSRDWYADNGISSLSLPDEYCIIELHMDAGASSARGGHVIIKAGYEADAYDHALADMLGVILPRRSNLIVGRNDLANVNRAAARGLNYRLVEFGFITNAEDIVIFNNRMEDIARGVLMSFGIAPEYKYQLGEPVFVKQKDTLDIGFNFKMPNNEGRFRWLLYDVKKDQWETLVEWTDANWISLAKDKSGEGYLVQCQLYDCDTVKSHLVDTKTVGTDAGSNTVINGTYAGWRGKDILLGCSSNNPDVDIAMKLYNIKTKKWFQELKGSWATFTPEAGTNYIVQFEVYGKDGRLLDYKAIGI